MIFENQMDLLLDNFNFHSEALVKNTVSDIDRYEIGSEVDAQYVELLQGDIKGLEQGRVLVAQPVAGEEDIDYQFVTGAGEFFLPDLFFDAHVVSLF